MSIRIVYDPDFNQFYIQSKTDIKELDDGEYHEIQVEYCEIAFNDWEDMDLSNEEAYLKVERNEIKLSIHVSNRSWRTQYGKNWIHLQISYTSLGEIKNIKSDSCEIYSIECEINPIQLKPTIIIIDD